MSLRWSCVLIVLVIEINAFINRAWPQQPSPEQARRITQWITELSDKHPSKRAEAKARLRRTLEEGPTALVAALLRHANVVNEKQEVRLQCRELLLTQQTTKWEDARKLIADELELPVRRIIDIPYLPYVLDDTFLFAIFNLASRTAGPTAKVYISVSFAIGEAQPVVRRHEDGISPEEVSRLLTASDFNIESPEDALDVAVLAAGLASTNNADGWCLIPQPDTAAPCDRWPNGKTLPRDLQDKAIKATVTSIANENAYIVNITTWAAVGGRVSNWRIRVNKNKAVKIEHHEIIGGAFGIGFS